MNASKPLREQAGTELTDVDAAIAAEIMGWARLPAGWRPSLHAHPAWHVVERMTELGYSACIDVKPDPPHIRVGFIRQGEDVGPQFSEVNVELAICLAALDCHRSAAPRVASQNGEL